MNGSKTGLNCAGDGEMATLKEKQRLHDISELKLLLQQVAKVPHVSKPSQPPRCDLHLLETASKEVCKWLHKRRIGIEEDPTSELGSDVTNSIVNVARGAINGDGGIVGCMNVLDTLYQFMWSLNKNQTIERETNRSHFVSAYSQLGILFATHLLEDLFEVISDCAHKVGRSELLYVQVLLRRWKSQQGVIDEVVVDELMGTLPPLSPGMMKEINLYTQKGRESLKQSQKCKSPTCARDQTASCSTSPQENLPSYLLTGPMRGERLRYNASMNKCAEDWKRREERRRRDQDSHSQLGQGWNRLDDKAKVVVIPPDYSSWGINGWELLPSITKSSSSNELVGSDMESRHLDVTPPPPLGGSTSEKFQLKPPDHHNRSNKCSSPPQLSKAHWRKSRWLNGVHSKGHQDDGDDTPIDVPLGGHGHPKKAKLKHDD